MGNIAAFFDIDGTLYRDSLLVEHFKKLIRYDIIDPSLWHAKAKKSYLNWDKRQGNYDDYLLEIANVYIDSIKGLTRNCIEFTSEQVISLKADRVYRYTRSQIKHHLNENHKVIFISGSPDFLVSKMAKKYGVNDYLGSSYIFKDDIFTGDVIPMWDSNSKNTAIDNFIKKYDIDPDKSYAYGDTHGDLSMLKKVGHAIAINPAKELLNCIKKDENLRNKTKIIVERKDVVYSLDSDITAIM